MNSHFPWIQSVSCHLKLEHQADEAQSSVVFVLGMFRYPLNFVFLIQLARCTELRALINIAENYK